MILAWLVTWWMFWARILDLASGAFGSKMVDTPCITMANVGRFNWAWHQGSGVAGQFGKQADILDTVASHLDIATG